MYYTTTTGSYKPVNFEYRLTPYGITFSTKYTIDTSEIKKYIINDGATIIFWSDGTKTVSKRHKDDEFDKELGFLFAYYYKKCGLSNASRKRVINSIDYSHIKTFLFEFYVNDTGKEPEKLKINKKYVIINLVKRSSSN